mmetsp:Transcript_21353/g.45834  ORF Transcript_21353/g.45834 Transcript_21353/m.45834 type:complete len:183 (-) Transcript_21353:412-960(-)|eukprot:CAMPEP_0183332212 /NCGR_PEP_ID=MMETSP0164_2-20130417/1429_1 /TAXON_ID=221442 /ORGANISM="Coccolithus pelagicus ssp braarudi, Strain PLY182g" /LENGTH=182 /DNA_ID=CAMNT_0025500877 /DNA_START=37 /DNA_END=585 /DNA_ORIENTATION=-
MSSDEDDEAEEDWRIAKLYAAADKASADDFALLLDEVGTKDAIVMGGVMMDALCARAHFVVMALLDADDGSIAECIEGRRKLLKAAVAAGGVGAGVALLSAIEGWVCSEVEEGEAREAALSSFGEVLKAVWEWDIVSEVDLREWQADERAARNLRVHAADARRMHERGRVFLEWIDRGEGGE